MNLENIPLMDLTTREEDGKRKQSEAFTIKPDYDINSVRSIIHKSARDGKTDVLFSLLEEFQGIANEGDMEQMTPLHYAARYGHVEAVDLLIRKGADVGKRNMDGDTALHLVAKYCKDETTREDLQNHFKVERTTPGRIINILVKAGADVNVKNNYGMAPLHFSAMKSNLIGVKKLLQKGAEVNSLDANKNTPLLLACIHGTVTVVELLLEADSNVYSKDQLNNTVYHIAALRGDPQLLELLLKRGGRANVNGLATTNHEGKTPLRMAVEGNHPETLKVILRFEQTYCTQWHLREKCIMHYVAGRGFFNILEELVKAGGDKRELDDMMRLPLHEAARYNQKDIIEYLLEPCSLEAHDQQGRTPLAVATSQDAIDSVKVLLEHGANVEAQDDEEATVIFIGAKYNALVCVDYILNYIKQKEVECVHNKTLRNVPKVCRAEEMVNSTDHNQMTPMHIVSRNGYLEMMRLLHAHGAVVNCINEDEETPLHLAASRGETLAVRLLLEWDRRLILHKDEMGNSALHQAARSGHDVTTNMLVDAGAEKEARNSYQQTPLMMAVQYEQLSTAQQLIFKGARVDNSGDAKSVLHIAADTGNENMVRFLLEAGATIDRVDLDNKTALDRAIERGSREVARVLLEDRNWRQLMIPSDELPVGRHKKTRDTPLRRLMLRFPDLAGLVLDKCVVTTENDTKAATYCISYDFQLMDDTYMMPSEDGQYLDGRKNAFNEEFRLLDNAKTYNDDYDIIYQNHPLKIMANAERLTLLRHPLSVALLKHKWNRLGRYVYYFALSIYILFITLITVYVTHTPAPFNIPVGDNFEDFSETFTNENLTCPKVVATRPHAIIKSIIIFLALLQLIKEGFQLAQRRLAYVSVENVIECFIYISAIVTVIDVNECSEQTGIKMNWQWLMAALCTFTAWMNLLLMIRKLPRFGIFVVMFFDIIRTFSKFSIIFFLFIFAFSTSFYVIMQNRPEFSSMGSSLMKTTVMMIGEYEFTSIFHGDKTDHAERLFGHAVAYPLFFFFCVIMTILLMNLLVGLAVDDIKSVQDKAELKRLCMQVDLVLQVEASIPYVRRIVARSGYAFFPNYMNFMKRLRNRFGYDASAEMLPEDTVGGETEMSEALRSTLSLQKARLENLQSNIDVMYEKQLTLEKLVRGLVKGLHIDVQIDDKD